MPPIIKNWSILSNGLEVTNSSVDKIAHHFNSLEEWNIERRNRRRKKKMVACEISKQIVEAKWSGPVSVLLQHIVLLNLFWLCFFHTYRFICDFSSSIHISCVRNTPATSSSISMHAPTEHFEVGQTHTRTIVRYCPLSNSFFKLYYLMRIYRHFFAKTLIYSAQIFVFIWYRFANDQFNIVNLIIFANILWFCS